MAVITALCLLIYARLWQAMHSLVSRLPKAMSAPQEHIANKAPRAQLHVTEVIIVTTRNLLLSTRPKYARQATIALVVQLHQLQTVFSVAQTLQEIYVLMASFAANSQQPRLHAVQVLLFRTKALSLKRNVSPALMENTVT